MAYTPVWETLAEALRRLVAAGQAEQDGKLDLCRAIADEAIAVQLVLAKDAHRPEIPVSATGLDLSGGILPSDVDWQLSRPIKPWPLAKPALSEFTTLYIARVGNHVDRTIKTIMVRSSDVSKIITPVGQVAPKPADDRPSPKSGSGAKAQGVEEAIRDVWADGIPKGLAAKDRDNQIIEWLKKRNLSVPSSRSIQRAIRMISKRS